MKITVEFWWSTKFVRCGEHYKEVIEIDEEDWEDSGYSLEEYIEKVVYGGEEGLIREVMESAGFDAGFKIVV